MRLVSLFGLAAAVGCGQAVTDSGVDTDTSTATGPDVSFPADAATSNAPESNVATNPAMSTDVSGSDAGANETGTSETTAPAARCRPADGTTGAPRSVVEVVQLVNGLPHPVTIACFLEALDRPLRILAASSFVSAQPAFSADNPRIFILGNGMSLSVVPDGDSRNLLEMGELTSNTRSIKAELEFPVEGPLSLDAAFTRIRSELYGGTVCFGCHSGEVAASDYPVAGAFDSIAYRPLPDYEVNFDYVKYQFTTCDAAAEPDRCAFYSALFAHGDVLSDRFPDDMPMFQ